MISQEQLLVDVKTQARRTPKQEVCFQDELSMAAHQYNIASKPLNY